MMAAQKQPAPSSMAAGLDARTLAGVTVSFGHTGMAVTLSAAPWVECLGLSALMLATLFGMAVAHVPGH